MSTKEDIYGGLVDEMESHADQLIEAAEDLLPMVPDDSNPKCARSSTKVGNVGGQSKVPFSVQQLAREYTEEAIETVVGIMRGSHIEVDEETGVKTISSVDNSTRLEAAKLLLDRGWGKATVKHNVEMKSINIHATLKELADTVQAPPSLIEEHGVIDAEVQ